MSKENEKAECPFSGQGEELVNVKFFRGSRNDLITADEIKAQARSAEMQWRSKTATVSQVAPQSLHPRINVADFLATL